MSLENKPRLNFIDSLRGLAALSVCLFHFSNGNTNLLPNDDWLKMIGAYGWVGVEVFFVISGFVLPWSLWDSPNRLGVFIRRRVLRIYPPYLASILLVIVLQLISMATPGYRGDGVFHVTGTALLAHLALACEFLGVEWYIPVYWTLAIEMQFYLVLAAFYLLARRSSPHLLCATFALLPLLDLTMHDPAKSFVSHYAAMFDFGIVLCFFRKRALSTTQTIGYLVLTTCIVALINGPVQAGACLTTALLFAIAFKKPFILENKCLMWFGNISYSLYLVHVPVGGRIINLTERLTSHVELRHLAILLAFGVSITFAALFYYCIERPSLQMMKRRTKLDPSVAPVS